MRKRIAWEERELVVLPTVILMRFLRASTRKNMICRYGYHLAAGCSARGEGTEGPVR